MKCFERKRARNRRTLAGIISARGARNLETADLGGSAMKRETGTDAATGATNFDATMGLSAAPVSATFLRKRLGSGCRKREPLTVREWAGLARP